jgi:hypothetical protein
MSLKEKSAQELQKIQNEIFDHGKYISMVKDNYPKKCNEFIALVNSICSETSIDIKINKEKVMMFEYSDNNKIGEVELNNIKLTLGRKVLQFKPDPGIGYVGAVGKIEILTNVIGWEKKYDLTKQGIFINFNKDFTEMNYKYLDSKIQSNNIDKNNLEKLIEAILTD